MDINLLCLYLCFQVPVIIVCRLSVPNILASVIISQVLKLYNVYILKRLISFQSQIIEIIPLFKHCALKNCLSVKHIHWQFEVVFILFKEINGLQY